MRLVAETLAETKLPGTMALAAKEKLSWCANIKLADILDIIENRA